MGALQDLPTALQVGGLHPGSSHSTAGQMPSSRDLHTAGPAGQRPSSWGLTMALQARGLPFRLAEWSEMSLEPAVEVSAQTIL